MNVVAAGRARGESTGARQAFAAEGQKPSLTPSYLRHSLVVLRGLSAVAASLVCKNVFKEPVIKGKLVTVLKPFEKNYTDAARSAGLCTIAP